MNPDRIPTVPASRILAGLAAEIHGLAGQADLLQERLAPLIQAGTPKSHDLRQSLQSIDYVTQALLIAGQVIETLAQASPKSWHIEHGPIMSRISLSSLARRFSEVVEPDLDVASRHTGDCELFDD